MVNINASATAIATATILKRLIISLDLPNYLLFMPCICNVFSFLYDYAPLVISKLAGRRVLAPAEEINQTYHYHENCDPA